MVATLLGFGGGIVYRQFPIISNLMVATLIGFGGGIVYKQLPILSFYGVSSSWWKNSWFSSS